MAEVYNQRAGGNKAMWVMLALLAVVIIAMIVAYMR